MPRISSRAIRENPYCYLSPLGSSQVGNSPYSAFRSSTVTIRPSSQGTGMADLATRTQRNGRDSDAHVYRVRGLSKTYGSGSTAVHALRGVDVEIDEGVKVAERS